MNKLRLLIGRSCRSDFPLSDPIIKALQEETEWCYYQIINLKPADFLESYKLCQKHFETFSYDLVLIIGDRIEAMALSLCAFLNNQKTIHLGSGVINDIGNNWDDLLRHSICLFSDIQLVEDINSFKVTHDLLEAIKKTNHNIHILGNFYADGLDDIDLSLVPDEPYDLILLNPTTLHEEQITLDKERLMIIIGPNPDPSKIDFINIQITVKNDNKFYHNLPRPQFLGLLSKCERYISNSSNVYYEAPHFLSPKQIIHIGARNMNRSTPTNLEGGSTEKIIEILKEWWDGKNE